MSIIITNIGGSPLGVCKYELKINNRLIATFEHNRPDGLSVCLSLAAEAAEKAKWENIATLIDWDNSIHAAEEGQKKKMTKDRKRKGVIECH